MKKKTKIILSCLLGVAVLGGVAIAVGVKSNTMLAGTIVEGTGEYDWHKNSAHIALNSDTNETEYYSNENDDIYDVSFYTVGKRHAFDDELAVCISYWTDFNIADDLEVIFVITNNYETYATDINRTHIPTFIDPEVISLPDKYADESYYISEIWVRTED